MVALLRVLASRRPVVKLSNSLDIPPEVQYIVMGAVQDGDHQLPSL